MDLRLRQLHRYFDSVNTDYIVDLLSFSSRANEPVSDQILIRINDDSHLPQSPIILLVFFSGKSTLFASDSCKHMTYSISIGRG